MPAKKTRETALEQLGSVLSVMDLRSSKQRPTVELLTTIRQMVGDAIAVLQEPDPLKQRIGFVLLAIRQSTEVKVKEVNGKRITRVTVTDQQLYHWALEEIHTMAGAS